MENKIVNFSDQNLQNRCFAKQNLINVNFSNSDLRGCDFSGANLQEANFTQVKTGISYEQKKKFFSDNLFFDSRIK